MQNIEKFLDKLISRERLRVTSCIEDIIRGQTDNLDVKRLRGKMELFRVRVGKIRIIYKRVGTSRVIVKVSWKNDNTYKNY